ncbi:MAG: hypothetical protein HFE49_02625 [Clostridia bacterium]|nr:hypothetical protein [Clostridia bacterium]
MKKLICGIMIAALLVMSIPAMAQGKCKISVENAEAVSGGTALVSLKIENNPNMAIGKIKLTFDKEKLMPVSAEKQEVLQSCYSFTSNLDDPNIDASELDYVTISWMNMADISGDGTLAVIEFAVLEGVSGSTDIAVEVSELANAMQNNIAADAVKGQITFTGGGDDKTDEDISLGFSETTVSKTPSSIGGSVSVSVYSPKALNAAFICTIYDDRGKLCAARIKNEALKSGINEVEIGDIRASANDQSSYAVKVYMWDSINGMKPLTSEPIMKRY